LKKFPLLPRKNKTDKRNYGHALILAGSESMPGAAVLAARAALISGAGLVTVAAPRALKAVFLKALPEAMLIEPSFAAIQQYIQKRNIPVLAIGPGLTVHPKVSALVRRLVAASTIPVVLDADGLNAFIGKAALLKKHRAPLVLTPHAGEYKRLFGSVVAKEAAKLYHGILVMKGHRTRVVDGKRDYVNKTGNPGLAKGGSGDVLTGIIAAFMAQGLEPFEAACWAVRCHGLAGDRVASRQSQLSVLASDLIRELPAVYKSLG
jgi:NAD(P)H-hydrate epimerase